MANQDKSTSSRVFGDSQAKEALSAHAAHGASRPVLVNANEARMSPCHVTQSNLDSRWNGNLHGAVSDDTGYVNHPLQSSSAYHGTPWIPLEQIDGQLAHYSIPEGHQPSPPYQDPTTEHFGYQPIQDDYSEGPWPSFLVPPD